MTVIMRRMPVYLDDQAVDLGAGPLTAILRTAGERLRGDGRIVVEVQLDGQPVSANDFDQEADLATSELRLYTADPRELAIEALEHVRDRLATARQMQSDAAELLQQDKAADALGKVGQANEAWLQAHQAVIMAADAGGVSLGTLTIDGEPASAYIQELVRSLTSLKDTLTHHDTVALADALAYEWPGMTDRWDRLVAQMVTTIEKNSAGEAR